MAFDIINEEQGMAHSYVLCIFQDSQGLIWVGSYGGLQVYYGDHFNNFNTFSKQSNILQNHVINVIYEDRNGNLWFGSESGLNKYSPKTGKVKYYAYETGKPEGLSHNHIRTIYQDTDGYFWIGTYGGGLNKLDEHTGICKHYRAKPDNPSGIQSDLINAFFVDNAGLFWIGTENGGISVFDKNIDSVVKNYNKSANGLSSNIVNAFFQDSDGTMWIGTWGGGLNRYNAESDKFTAYVHSPFDAQSISGNNVRSIVQTERGYLWIGTFGEGLNRFDIEKGHFTKITFDITKEYNNSQEVIWTMIRDREKQLWLGTFGRGLIKENTIRNTFNYQTIKSDEGVKQGITAAMQLPNGQMWLGTSNKGIFVFSPQNKNYQRLANERIQNLNASVIYRDRKNRIWIGAEYALYAVTPDFSTIRKFEYKAEHPSGISEGSVNTIHEDKYGNIWLGFWSMGLNIIKNGELNKTNDNDVVFSKYKTELNDTAGYLDYRIWRFFEDSRGTIWIGTANKLASYSQSKKKLTEIPVGVASSFYEDADGFIWVGSAMNGLFKIDKDGNVLKNYRTENGLASMDILSIMADKRGRIWLGSPAGLTIYDPRTDDFSNFDKNYGLQTFSITHNACMLLNNGKMFYGGNNGINITIPENIDHNMPKSDVVITDIKLNNKSILYENVSDSTASIFSTAAYLDTLLLDHKNKVLTIDFVAVNYTMPSGISYAYRLSGFNDTWVVTGANNRSATYTNLKPGEYVFELRMSYSKGKWHEGTKKLRIIITPPFWQTIWFKTILSILLLSLVAILFSFRIRVITRKHEKERLKKEREIIRLQNEKLHSELDFKNKELAQSTIHVIRKNEDIIDIKTQLEGLTQHTDQAGRKKLNEILRLIDHKLDDRANWEYFEYNFNLLHNNFLNRFTEKYPDINQNDLKICAYIRMNLSTKEMGNLLNVSYRTIESTRYRIRKKINIESDLTLNDYIMRF